MYNELIETNTYEEDDYYRPEVLEQTQKLLQQYYSGKLKGIAKYHVEKSLEQIRDEPLYEILELHFGKYWHPEHIGKRFRCRESRVPKLVDQMVRRTSIAFFGVDALKIV